MSITSQVRSQAKEATKSVSQAILDYLHSGSPGGEEVIKAFMDEFRGLASRSPKDDPTNIINFIDDIETHIKNTWDSNISIDESGNLNVGVGKDEFFGFKEDKSKLAHHPTPVMWVVYLIRGIAGKYAFVNPQMYFEKKGRPMPSQYYGGFLINKYSWDLEGWGRVLGDFDKYEHPASGAASIPFFNNVMQKINMGSIIDRALKEAGF